MRGLTDTTTDVLDTADAVASEPGTADAVAIEPGSTDAVAIADGAAGAPAAGDLARTLNETLRTAIDRHGASVVLLCSFQKEESVLIDELLRIGDGRTDVRIATIDTGVLFPETLRTWKDFERRFGIEVEVYDASNPQAPWSGPEHCCSAAKVAALEQVLGGADAWITGIRREQGPTRATTELIERDEKRALDKYNPLALWSEKALWQRIFERDLPYNPLHDRGFSSIGCAPCTLPGEGREGRWAGTDKTECGLHL